MWSPESALMREGKYLLILQKIEERVQRVTFNIWFGGSEGSMGPHFFEWMHTLFWEWVSSGIWVTQHSGLLMSSVDANR